MKRIWHIYNTFTNTSGRILFDGLVLVRWDVGQRGGLCSQTAPLVIAM